MQAHMRLFQNGGIYPLICGHSMGNTIISREILMVLSDKPISMVWSEEILQHQPRSYFVSSNVDGNIHGIDGFLRSRT